MKEELYYIQNRGYCGDCLLWWRSNRCGYTMNLKEALKVTAAEAATFTRIEDVPWPVSDIDAIAQHHVNSEHLGNAKPAALVGCGAAAPVGGKA